MSRFLLATAVLVVVAAGALAVVTWGAPSSGGEDAHVAVPEQATVALVVVDRADPYIGGPLRQTEAALQRAKLPYRLHDLAADPALPSLDGVRVVLTVAERLGQIPDASVDRLEAFVEGGGGLVVVHRGWGARIAPLLGFADVAPPAFDTHEQAFTFTEALMPGGGDLTLPPQALSSYRTRVQPACTVLGVRGDHALPTLWSCPRGRGRVVVWNSALLGTKPYRGFLLQSVAAVYPDHARPLANWAVIDLDDFPSPASNGQVAPVWQQSRQTPAQFYAETWYTDMRALADRYGLVYTTALIFAYNDRTEPPFPLREWLVGQVEEGGGLRPYAPWIASEAAHHDEMGLHGYNHQSLQLRTWGSKEKMTAALRVARKRWAYERFGPLPRTYVPPMNWIDSTGVAALAEVFPEIETISGLYFGSFAEGQDREFGPEPWAPALYALPRNTSGFLLTETQRLQLLSVLQTVGAWHHFVHPDEVFSNPDREATYALAGLPPPGEIGWYGTDGQGFYPRFEQWLQFLETNYPWLDYVTTVEATRRMRRADALEVSWESRGADAGRDFEVYASLPGQVVTTFAAPGEALASLSGAEVLQTWRGPLMTQLVLRLDGTRATLRFTDGADA